MLEGSFRYGPDRIAGGPSYGHRSDPARQRRVDPSKSCRWSESASDELGSRQCFVPSMLRSCLLKNRQLEQSFFPLHTAFFLSPLSAMSLTLSMISSLKLPHLSNRADTSPDPLPSPSMHPTPAPLFSNTHTPNPPL